MFNRVVMLGNLTRDCELRYLPSGGAICTTGLATNRKFKKQDGSQGEEVCFIDITFFGRTAEIANQYLHRGSKVLVEGRLKLDQWTDNQSVKRSKHSITVESLQMIDTRQAGAQEEAPKQENKKPKVTVQKADGQEYEMPDINDDEIPFSGGIR